MPVAKRGARVGVAAFALGVSLAGPHTVGTAAAEPTENDAPSVSADSTPSGQNAQPRVRGSRSGQPADSGADAARRGRVNPQPAAAADALVPDVADLPEARPARGQAHPRMLPEPVRDSASEGVAQQTTAPSVSATVSPAGSNAGPAGGPQNATLAVPAPQSAPAAAASVNGPDPRGAAGAAAAVTTPAVSAPPPALAKPAAVIGTMITSAFDAAANWLASLPNGPFTDFFEGALLLVRRTFFNLFPALDVGRTTGQQVTDPSYFTQAELRDYLLGLAKQQYGDLYGQTVPVYGYGPYPEYYKANTDAAQGSTTSDTNTQVNGVDEADFVETDGTYVYVARNNQLTIVRGDDLTVASQSSLSGNVVGQYLSGDRLTVVSQSGNGWYGPMVKMAAGYYWGPWKPQTTVTVYDVSDRTAPLVVKQTTFDGDYQSSRAVDGMVYLVLQRSVNLPAPEYTETPVPPKGDPVPLDASADAALLKRPYPGDGPIAYRTYESWDSYAARVGDTIVDQSLPHAYSVDAEGNLVDLGLLAGAGDIVRPGTPDQQSLATVVSIDSRGPGAPAAFSDSVAAMVSGWGSTVYMNTGALYVATTQDGSTATSHSTDTRIDRFTVDGAKVGWQGTGVVSGTLINQFAMDEKDGYLRVATHTDGSQLVDGVWTNRNDSGVYVLDTSGKVLDQVGQLTGLAPGEDLYAVRYVGDTAYLVTFVRTDPLFVIDMSDPKNSELQGELVVPGFSNYLQSVGDGLLLGVGQEREDGNWNTHLQASLFNVADSTNPIQLDREYLDSGYQWSWSDAQFDHHALLYSAADGLLVIPVAASGYDPQTGYRYTQYLKVLRVGSAGLEVVGEIHPAEAAIRTVRIGDVLYAVGETSVTAYRLSDLSEIATTAPAPAVV